MNSGNGSVRVGLVGLGGHGRTIQRAAADAGNLDVRAVFDVDEHEAEAAAERFGCTSASSLEGLLGRDDLEAVILVTPNHLHRPHAEAALAAGLDVFVEKPIANTTRDGSAMVEAAERSGRILMVGHHMRRTRPARLAKAMLDEQRLGNVVTAEIHFSTDTALRLSADSWRLNPQQCPLMPVMQLGIHAIDLIHFFLAPIVTVSSRGKAVTVRSGAVDSIVSTFETESGVLGTLVSNYCTPVAFEFRVSGTQGSLRGTPHRLSYRSLTDTDGRGEGPSEEHDFRAFDLESYVLQMREFGESVRTRRPPETNGRVGLQALSVVEAMERSVKSGRVQQVPLVHETREER